MLKSLASKAVKINDKMVNDGRVIPFGIQSMKLRVRDAEGDAARLQVDNDRLSRQVRNLGKDVQWYKLQTSNLTKKLIEANLKLEAVRKAI